jgi:hypothetical protein
MDTPRRFTESPRKGGRGLRFLRHPGFPEALAFQRILIAAEKGDPSVLNEWQALFEQEIAARYPAASESPEDESLSAVMMCPRDAEPLEPQRRRRRRRHSRVRRFPPQPAE